MVKDGRKSWQYSDIPTDLKGWVVEDLYRPFPFDLCCLLIKDKDKSINGWWTGYKWEGLRLKKKYQVSAWRISKEFI